MMDIMLNKSIYFLQAVELLYQKHCFITVIRPLLLWPTERLAVNIHVITICHGLVIKPGIKATQFEWQI